MPPRKEGRAMTDNTVDPDPKAREVMEEIVKLLEPFDDDARRRIVKAVREKLANT
jgi:hypothetical protein